MLKGHHWAFDKKNNNLFKEISLVSENVLFN